MVSSKERMEREVAALGDLPREELAARWTKVYGCPPPKGVKRGLLERAAAWHLQARQLGGLSHMARKVIRDTAKRDSVRNSASGMPAETGDSGTIDVDISHKSASRRGKAPTIHQPAPRPGARLIREWNGRTHVVDVSEDGFVFDGKTYRSLTAIAKRITGAHWSGPRFFGL